MSMENMPGATPPADDLANALKKAAEREEQIKAENAKLRAEHPDPSKRTPIETPAAAEAEPEEIAAEDVLSESGIRKPPPMPAPDEGSAAAAPAVETAPPPEPPKPSTWRSPAMSTALDRALNEKTEPAPKSFDEQLGEAIANIPKSDEPPLPPEAPPAVNEAEMPTSILKRATKNKPPEVPPPDAPAVESAPAAPAVVAAAATAAEAPKPPEVAPKSAKELAEQLLKESGFVDIPSAEIAPLFEGDMDKVYAMVKDGKQDALRSMIAEKVLEATRGSSKNEAFAASAAAHIQAQLEKSYNEEISATIANSFTVKEKAKILAGPMAKRLLASLVVGTTVGVGTAALLGTAGGAAVLAGGLTAGWNVFANSAMGKRLFGSKAEEEFKKLNDEKRDEVLSKMLTKEALAALTSNAVREISAQSLIEDAALYKKAADEASTGGGMESAKFELALNHMQPEFYKNALNIIAAKHPEYSPDQQKEAAILLAATVGRYERGQVEEAQYANELEKNNKSVFDAVVGGFAKIRSGNTEGYDSAAKTAVGAASIGLGAATAYALKSSPGLVRIANGAISGGLMGWSTGKMLEARARGELLEEAGAMTEILDGAEKTFEAWAQDPNKSYVDGDFYRYRDQSESIQARLNLGLFDGQPLLKSRAENFVYRIDQMDTERAHKLDSLVDSLAARNKSIEENESEDTRKLDALYRKGEKRKYAAVAGGMVLGALSMYALGEMFGTKVAKSAEAKSGGTAATAAARAESVQPDAANAAGARGGVDYKPDAAQPVGPAYRGDVKMADYASGVDKHVEAEPSDIIVKKGDWLSKFEKADMKAHLSDKDMAAIDKLPKYKQAFMYNELARKIAAENPEIKDIDKIEVGQHVRHVREIMTKYSAKDLIELANKAPKPHKAAAAAEALSAPVPKSDVVPMEQIPNATGATSKAMEALTGGATEKADVAAIDALRKSMKPGDILRDPNNNVTYRMVGEAGHERLLFRIGDRGAHEVTPENIKFIKEYNDFFTYKGKHSPAEIDSFAKKLVAFDKHSVKGVDMSERPADPDFLPGGKFSGEKSAAPAAAEVAGAASAKAKLETPALPPEFAVAQEGLKPQNHQYFSELATKNPAKMKELIAFAESKMNKTYRLDHLVQGETLFERAGGEKISPADKDALIKALMPIVRGEARLGDKFSVKLSSGKELQFTNTYDTFRTAQWTLENRLGVKLDNNAAALAEHHAVGARLEAKYAKNAFEPAKAAEKTAAAVEAAPRVNESLLAKAAKDLENFKKDYGGDDVYNDVEKWAKANPQKVEELQKVMDAKGPVARNFHLRHMALAESLSDRGVDISEFKKMIGNDLSDKTKMFEFHTVDGGVIKVRGGNATSKAVQWMVNAYDSSQANNGK